MLSNSGFLKFIGNGNSFNSALGNNSAYYRKGSTLILFDCGGTVFNSMLQYNVLNGIDNIYVFITHTHPDHIGSLGDLIFYFKYYVGNAVNLIFPEEEWLKSLLLGMGVGEEAYSFIREDSILKDDLKIKYSHVTVKHVDTMKCFGYLLNLDGKSIYYSGDACSVPSEVLILLIQDKIDYLYQDTSMNEASKNVHLYYEELKETIKTPFRSIVYCMHLDTSFDIKKAEEDGFKVAANINEISLKNKFNRLNKIGTAISAEKDSDKLFKMILDESIEITNSDGGTLYTREKINGRECMVFKFTTNKTIDFKYKGEALAIDRKSIAGYVALTGEVLVLNDMSDLFDKFGVNRNVKYENKNYRIGNMLVIPMKNNSGEVIGVLQILNKKNSGYIMEGTRGNYVDYSEEDVEILSFLASQATVLMDKNNLNLKLEKTIKETRAALITLFNGMKPVMDTLGEDILAEQDTFRKYATLDSLTGVMTRLEGMAFLEKQLELARLNRVNLVVCFIDVNGLKYVNDNYGHQEGDNLLKALSNIIKETIRSNDFVFRYGGDEFVIILYNTNIAGAGKLYKRMQDKMGAAASALNKEYSLSAAYGFAEFVPGEPKSTDELIKEADEAMYKNKKEMKKRA